MNTRVNIYIFTQICHHIYFRPDLVQQSRFISEVNSWNDNHSGRERKKKKKSFEECEFKKKETNWLHKIILAVQEQDHPWQALARQEATPQSCSQSAILPFYMTPLNLW